MYDLALILQTFGTRVRELRQSKGLSQMDLARAAGLHRTYIADVERGGRNSSMGSIAKIARALEISISDLCRGIENETGATGGSVAGLRGAECSDPG